MIVCFVEGGDPGGKRINKSVKAQHPATTDAT